MLVYPEASKSDAYGARIFDGFELDSIRFFVYSTLSVSLADLLINFTNILFNPSLFLQMENFSGVRQKRGQSFEYLYTILTLDFDVFLGFPSIREAD